MVYRVNHLIDIDNMAEEDIKLPQKAGEALWAAATHNNHEVASSRSAVYRLLDTAFEEALFWCYKLNATQIEKVREALAFYGPDDSLTDTRFRGIQSYVEYVLRYPDEKVC